MGTDRAGQQPSAPAADFSRYALLLTAGQAVFCLQDVAVKALGNEVGVLQFALVRACFGLAIVGALAALLPRFARPIRNWPAATARSLLQVAALLLYFTALTELPIAVAATGFYTFPILTTLLSAAFSGERLPPVARIAAPLGFLGAAIILAPGAAALDPAVVLPLMAAVAYALAVIVTHHACADEDPFALVRLQTCTFLAAGGAALLLAEAGAAPQAWTWRAMETWHWGALAVVAALNLGTAVLLLHVYQRASPARLAPLSYSYLAFAALADWALWGTAPTGQTLLGGALTALAGILVLRSRRSQDGCRRRSRFALALARGSREDRDHERAQD